MLLIFQNVKHFWDYIIIVFVTVYIFFPVHLITFSGSILTGRVQTRELEVFIMYDLNYEMLVILQYKLHHRGDTGEGYFFSFIRPCRSSKWTWGGGMIFCIHAVWVSKKCVLVVSTSDHSRPNRFYAQISCFHWRFRF